MREIVETEEVHFLDGLLDSPIVFGDAICGHHDAGAVFTVLTMSKIVWPGEQRKTARNWATCSLIGDGQPLTGI
jgi:hypothetical protein